MGSGVFKAHFLRALLASCPSLMPLVRIIKLWARRRELNDPRNGTLNSYCLGLLCILHLQTLAQPQLPPLWRFMPALAGDASPPPSAARPMHAGARPADGDLDRICAAISSWRSQKGSTLSQQHGCSFDALVHGFFIQLAAYAVHRLRDRGDMIALSTWAGGYRRRAGPPKATTDTSVPDDSLTLLQELVQAVHAVWDSATAQQHLPSAFQRLCACAADTLLTTQQAETLQATCAGLGPGFERAQRSSADTEASAQYVADMRACLADVADRLEPEGLRKAQEVVVERMRQQQAAKQERKRAAQVQTDAVLAGLNPGSDSTSIAAGSSSEAGAAGAQQQKAAAAIHQANTWSHEDDLIVDMSDTDDSGAVATGMPKSPQAANVVSDSTGSSGGAAAVPDAAGTASGLQTNGVSADVAALLGRVAPVARKSGLQAAGRAGAQGSDPLAKAGASAMEKLTALNIPMGAKPATRVPQTGVIGSEAHSAAPHAHGENGAAPLVPARGAAASASTAASGQQAQCYAADSATDMQADVADAGAAGSAGEERDGESDEGDGGAAPAVRQRQKRTDGVSGKPYAFFVEGA